MTLQGLPYEVLFYIVQEISLEDVFNLSLTCKWFCYLSDDDRTCKALLETQVNNTIEVREAVSTQQWSRAFRRLIKRRQAVREAAPYTAAVLAVAKSWLYASGVLCHVQDRTLRVLDLHGPSNSIETVVDVRGLLDQAAPTAWISESPHQGQAALGRRRFKFSLLHYACGLLSCLYTSRDRHNQNSLSATADSDSYLVVVNVAKQSLVTCKPLVSTHRIFVRNDATHLYVGTHSEIGHDGYRRWVLMDYDIALGEWLPSNIHLTDVVGSDIGQTVCFEIIDGFFYGLSNLTTFVIDEADWISHYYAFRFPVSKSQAASMERSVKEKMWRRQHAEGPIDDRWTSLRLVKNEDDGRLQITEARREWLDCRSSSQRTYYTTDLVFPSSTSQNTGSKGGGGENGAGSASSDTDTLATASHSSLTSNHTNSTANSTRNGNTSMSFTPTHSNVSSFDHPVLACNRRNSYTLPIKCAPRPRDPFNVHFGDDSSTDAFRFPLSKCPVRTYHHASQSFLDLVENDPTIDDSCSDVPRLQIRAGARYPVPYDTIVNDKEAHDDTAHHAARICRLYRDAGANKITCWPPSPDDATQENEAAEMALLEKVVNPPTHVGGVRGVWDEQTLLYSTGANEDGLQAIILVGFDPAIKLEGLREWGAQGDDNKADCPVEGRDIPPDESAHLDKVDDTNKKGKGASDLACPESSDYGAATEEEDTFVWEDEQRPMSPAYSTSGSDSSDMIMPMAEQPQAPFGSIASSESKHWAWTETAMHMQIGFGYTHLPDFNKRKRGSAAVAITTDTI